MTSSDQHPDEPARAPEGAAPTHPETSSGGSAEQDAAPPADAGNAAPSRAAHAGADEDGPQPGNEKAEDDSDGEDDDDGPAPGNEREPGAPAAAETGAATPGTPGKKKRRRRRKKKPEGAQGEAGAAPQQGAAHGEGGEAAEGGSAEPRDGEHARHQGKKKERPPRERPAFNPGDVVFGKIVEITDDALFVDLSGKARAIFDRREMDLPDDLEYGADPEAMDEEPLPAEAAPAEAPAEGASHEEGAEPAADASAFAEAGASPDLVHPTPGGSQGDPKPDFSAELTHVTDGGDGGGDGGSQGDPKPDLQAASPELALATPHAPHGSQGDPKPDFAMTEAHPSGSSGSQAAPKVDSIAFPLVTIELGAHFVGIVHNDGGRGGLVVLTRHPKRMGRAKLVVGGAFKEKGEILGLVTGVIKGGVEVDVDGLRAFAPGSHMDLRLGTDLHPLVGKRLLFVVTQYAKRGKDVVLSRKPFLEAEAKIHREAALKTLPIGTVVEGTVRSVVPFGAFLDVGGVEGLVPLSEMSHNRGDGPHDVFKVGDKTPVKIMKVDERGKVWLSRRAAIPDPWLEVAKKYAVGTKLTGKIARLQPFGAFIELEPGIDGLIHSADLSLKKIEHPNEVVKEGDSIDVVVVHLEVGAHRIGLHPAPTGDAANETPQRVQLNKPVKVAVVGYEGNGLVVRILGATGRHARGFISPAATGTPRGTDLRREFPMGKQLDAKVTELDPRRGEIKLSVKALSEDTERTAYRQYREQVTREAKFGTFGDLLKKNMQQGGK